MSIRSKLLAASVALAVATPASAATTVFFNDWDSTDFGAGPGFVVLGSYEGWTAVAGSGIEVQFNGVAGAPFSGENLVELDSHNNSTMERAIGAGSYELTFYYSPRPGIDMDSNGIDVLVNGVSIFNVTGNGGGGTGWTLQTVNFALGAPGTLRFAATGDSDSLGGYIENVTLSAIPEPATWAMMIGGFGVIGAAMRRRGQMATKLA